MDRPNSSKSIPRRVLVTGGLGFVGFHLCHSLLSKQPHCELTIVDNLSSTRIDYRSLINRADIHIQDLRTYDPGNQAFDEIFHLASPVGSLKILENHGRIATDIMQLAQIASDLAAKNNARLLYLSSSEVYGRDGRHDESADQIVPSRRGTRMEYALGKLTAEHMLLNLADNQTHEVRIVRPFNVVGRHQSEALGFVMPGFFKSALNNDALLVHGDGQQTRSFCAVEDLVNGILKVQSRGKASEIYNIGNPANKISIEGLAHKIKEICQSSASIRFIDPVERYGNHYLEAYNKQPVIDKVVADTGWKPSLYLQDILIYLREHFTSAGDVRVIATSAEKSAAPVCTV